MLDVPRNVKRFKTKVPVFHKMLVVQCNRLHAFHAGAQVLEKAVLVFQAILQHQESQKKVLPLFIAQGAIFVVKVGEWRIQTDL
jgi:hypothetical protein